MGAGGLKGAYQVGLLLGLDDRHLNRITRCSGVSTGAITGACVMSPTPRATMEAYYHTAKTHALVPSGNKFWRATKRYLTHKDALYDGNIFERLVRETLMPLARGKVLDVGVKPMASRAQHSVQLTNDTSFDNVVHSVMASAAIMGVFPPRNLPSLGPCVDGGFISALNLPRLRHVMATRDPRVMMVVACLPSCATEAGAEAQYMGETDTVATFDPEAPTMHSAVLELVDHIQRMQQLGDLSRLRHELGLKEMPEGVFGALYDGSGNFPFVYNVDTPMHKLPVAPAASAKPMAMVYCAPTMQDGFDFTTSDIAMMTGNQEKRCAVLEKYHEVGTKAAPSVNRLLDVAAKWTVCRR